MPQLSDVPFSRPDTAFQPPEEEQPSYLSRFRDDVESPRSQGYKFERIDAAPLEAASHNRYRPELNLVDLYYQTRESVARIQSDNGKTGTGFFVTADGMLATDYHVVQNAGQVYVTTGDGRTYRAYVETVDRANDLAVLQVQPYSRYERFRPLELGSSQYGVGPGSQVFTVGHPNGQYHASLSRGVAQAMLPYYRIARPDELPYGNNPYRQMMLVSMYTERGNSGGPLVDSMGRVVGIVDLSNRRDLTSATPVEALETLLAYTWQRRRYERSLGWDGYYGQRGYDPGYGQYGGHSRYDGYGAPGYDRYGNYYNQGRQSYRPGYYFYR